MRYPKEIVILLVLLLCSMAAVLWYVVDRRARLLKAHSVAVAPATPPPVNAAGPASVLTAAPAPPATPNHPIATASGPEAAAPAGKTAAAQPVDLSKHDGQTIDFSSGQPVVKQTPEDKAALDAGVKDLADATKNVTFGPAPAPAKP